MLILGMFLVVLTAVIAVFLQIFDLNQLIG